MPEPTEVTPEVTPTQTPDATPAEATPATDNTLLGAETKESTETKTEAESEKKVIPEKYELKIPDGMTLDKGMLDSFTPVFKEIGLTQEQAQKLADAYVPMIKKQSESVLESYRQESMKEYDKMTEDWKQMTIKELGADYQKKLAPAAKLIDRSGFGKEIREMMSETRVGNHPVMVRFLTWVGSKISEDSFAEPNKQSTGSTSFYDHPTSKATLK